MSKIIAKAGQQVFKLCWPDGDLLTDRNVDASNEEIKRIIARGLAGDDTAQTGAGFVKISAKIAVRAYEQGLNKRIESVLLIGAGQKSAEYQAGPNRIPCRGAIAH